MRPPFPRWNGGCWAGWFHCSWVSAVRGLPARRRFWIGFSGGFAAAAAIVFWLWPIFSFASLFLWGILAFYFGLWALLSQGITLPRYLFPIWTGVAWCGVEYLRGELAPLCFSWLALGYSQQNLIGSRLASVAGIYGVSMVMVIWGAAVAELGRHVWKMRGEGPSAASARLRAGLLLLASLPLLTLIGVPQWQGESRATAELQQLAEHDEIADLPETQPAASAPPDLIIWPEYCLFDDPYANHASWFLSRMKGEAGRSRQGVIFGAIDFPDGRSSDPSYWNTAFCLSAGGELLGKAVKNQPIQLLSDGEPASDISVLEIPPPPADADDRSPLRAGVGICYDGSFQRFSTRMARRGAEVLIFPTFNAASWGATQHRQHQRMFQTRAAETGLPVLVAAVSGPTFAAFPGGSASEALPFGRTGRVRVKVSPPAPPTHYVRWGWVTSPAACLLTLGGAILGAWRHAGTRAHGQLPLEL